MIEIKYRLKGITAGAGVSEKQAGINVDRTTLMKAPHMENM